MVLYGVSMTQGLKESEILQLNVFVFTFVVCYQNIQINGNVTCGGIVMHSGTPTIMFLWNLHIYFFLLRYDLVLQEQLIT